MSDKKYLDSLQVLRGLAALTIVLSHIPIASVFGQALGNFGVAIFYTLSGFLTIYVAKPGAVKFLKKRVLRIVPLYWAITLVTYVIATVKPGLFGNTVAKPEYLVKSLFFIPYYNPNTFLVRPILEVGWTLTMEVIFYLIFALAIRLNFKYRNVITLCGLLMFYFALGAMYDGYALVAYKYWVKYFAMGLCIAWAWPVCDKWLNEHVKNIQLPTFVAVVAEVVIILVACRIFGQHDQVYTYIWGLLPLMILIIMAIFLLFNYVSKASKTLMLLGDISFELYLTHEYIVKGTQRLIMPLDVPGVKTAVVAVFCVIAALICSYFVHKIYDKIVTKFLTF